MFIKRKEGETPSAFLYRFSKKMQQSGILKEVKKRKFHHRTVSRTKRKLSAIYRDAKRKETIKKKKLGLL
jgi:ribosomal protein S21